MILNKRYKRGIILLSLFVIVFTGLLLSSVNVKATRTYAPGVCGTPPTVDPWGPNNDWEFKPHLSAALPFWWCTDGIYTDTLYGYEIFLPGPIHAYHFDPLWVYVKENNIIIDQVIAWVPVFYIESKSWYSHELKVESSSSNEFKAEFKAGISSLSGGCSIYGGHSRTTSNKYTSGWTETVDSGHWKVIYLRTVYLRVHGTAKFWNNEIRTYDAVILEDVDFGNRFVTSDTLGDTKELPEFTLEYYDSDGDGQADKFYYLGTTYFEYSQVKSTTNYVELKLGVSNKYFNLHGEAKFTETSSSGITIRHSFQGTLPSGKYFNLKMNNYFTLNLEVHSTGGGGGGCPILSIHDGEGYYDEGLLDIHDPDGIDQITTHSLRIIPEPINNRYLLRLTEHPITISHLDKVEFFGRLPDGQLVSLSLKSAAHSSLGNVKQMLKSSDDIRVDILGADHNDGISQHIDLEFETLHDQNFVGFEFVIEGHNYIIK